MKQAQYAPLSIAEMAFSLFAANEGFLDDVDSNKIVDFEAALHSYLRAEHQGFLDELNASADYNDDIAAKMKKAIEDFKANHVW